jgi:hypothetical protein
MAVLQQPISWKLPRTLREAYAETLNLAEREYRDAQTALGPDDSDATRALYARALAEYDKLQAVFPFVAAGSGDVEVKRVVATKAVPAEQSCGA